MLTKTEAIVLHSFKYGEARLIVEMFTRQEGRLSFIVQLPKTPRSKLKKQFFQPLTLLEVVADLRPNAQLQKLKDARLLAPFTSLPFEPVKLSISLFLAEFLYHATKGEQQNAPLFDYIVSSLQWLDNCQQSTANFHLVFLMRLNRFLGFYPNLEDYRPGSFFDLRTSGFCRSAPMHHDFLAPAEAEKLQLMMRMDYATMHLFALSRHDRQRLLDVALTYYRLHLPVFPELRSLPVLQELYD